MAAPIGKVLREARLARDLTLEDVQHITRIARPILAAMENDDLGAFPNQTYARKFFAAYARHLGVDVTEFLRHFRPAGLGGVVQYHAYLQPPADRVGPDNRRPQTRHAQHPSGLLFAGLAALALVGGLAVWSGLRDRQAGAPAGTLPIQTAPGTAASTSSARNSPAPDTAPPHPTGLAIIRPPDLPVLRATPVGEDETNAAVPAAPAGPKSLPLVESPAPPAKR